MAKNSHELTRKELKGPDQFQQAMANVAVWIGAHQKQIAAGVVAAVGVAALAVWIAAWLEYDFP